LLAFSGRMFSSCPFISSEELDEDESNNVFTIEAKRLKQWLRSIPNESITFSFDSATKIVTASVKQGSQEFRSLDPKDFPFWDDLKVSLTATVEAERFSNALSYARKFVGDLSMEGTDP